LVASKKPWSIQTEILKRLLNTFEKKVLQKLQKELESLNGPSAASPRWINISVLEDPVTGEEHYHAQFVGGFDNIVVAY